jgi:uncharacterized protein (DUF305 family)
MEKQPLLYGVIGLLLGAIIATTTAAYAVNNNRPRLMGMMGIDTNGATFVTTSTSAATAHDMSAMGHDMGDTMTNMQASLAGKTGDAFDRAFLSEMIVHHQGAVDMAVSAKAYAKHDELKQMADVIITAQNAEIAQMKTWQKQWGYDAGN